MWAPREDTRNRADGSPASRTKTPIPFRRTGPQPTYSIVRLTGRSRTGRGLEPPAEATAPRESARVLVARQPIVDRNLELHGYELLFRGPRGPVAQPEQWTASLIVDGLTELGLKAIVGDALAYINFPRGFLLNVDPLPFAPEGVVLELTEDSHQTDAVLLARLGTLRAQGYRIALDDFAYDPSLHPLIERADLVKLDIMADGLERTAEVVGLLRNHDVGLLAEKVETRAEFEFCRELGFETFQGYFFAKPREISGIGLAADKLAGLGTLAAINDPNIGLEELERLIASDVGLAYKLLRYINSGFFCLTRRIQSVHDALVLLGPAKVRQWATVMVLAGSTSSPPALISLALLRARLCQSFAAERGGVPDDTAFMAGLFSVLDALLDVRMELAVERLPLSEDLKAALLTHGGALGAVLSDVVSIEGGRLDVLAEVDAGAYAEASAYADQAVHMTV